MQLHQLELKKSVGYTLGETFKTEINFLINNNEPLNNVFLPYNELLSLHSINEFEVGVFLTTYDKLKRF